MPSAVWSGELISSHAYAADEVKCCSGQTAWEEAGETESTVTDGGYPRIEQDVAGFD